MRSFVAQFWSSTSTYDFIPAAETAEQLRKYRSWRAADSPAALSRQLPTLKLAKKARKTAAAVGLPRATKPAPTDKAVPSPAPLLLCFFEGDSYDDGDDAMMSDCESYERSSPLAQPPRTPAKIQCNAKPLRRSPPKIVGSSVDFYYLRPNRMVMKSPVRRQLALK